MTGPESGIARTAAGASRVLVTLGAIVVMACVGYLTYTWWRDGRWVWVALGIVVIAVNIGLLIASFRPVAGPASAPAPAPAPSPPTSSEQDPTP